MIRAQILGFHVITFLVATFPGTCSIIPQPPIRRRSDACIDATIRQPPQPVKAVPAMDDIKRQVSHFFIAFQLEPTHAPTAWRPVDSDVLPAGWLLGSCLHARHFHCRLRFWLFFFCCYFSKLAFVYHRCCPS